MALRDYQTLGVGQIRVEFKNGRKRVLLVMPTGAGKTTVFTHMMREAAKNGRKSLMLVRGRQLIQQAHTKLMRENTHHGVLMGNHWARNDRALIQLASIDTITARRIYPKADLIIIDEAHLATSQGYKETLEQYPDAFVVAVTATPWTREPLRHIGEAFVKPISMQELVDQGYLLSPRYFAPSAPDLDGVKIVSGDYVQSQLQERMAVLSGDIIDTWLKKGESRPTLMFAVNIEHSLSLVADFKRRGIAAEHIEASHSFQEREAAIKRLVSGQTKILSNVGVLCTGVDIPAASCLILARPTRSYNLFVQICGRGTRCDYTPGMPLDTAEQRFKAIAASNKQDFIILDHSGNVTRHGFINDEPEIDLDGKKKKLNTGPAPKTCPTCFLQFVGPFCYECQITDAEKKEREIIYNEEEELVEIKRQSTSMEMIQFVTRMKEEALKKGFKPKQYAHMKVRQKYGQRIADEIIPLKRQPKALPTFLRK